jgi:Tfp pilus assembly protein PilO
MTKTRAWIAGATALGLLLSVASWFLLISPQRSEAASLREQATSQRAFNDEIKTKTKQLQAQFASLPARQAQLDEIRQQMPNNPALPSLVRSLSEHAESSGVNLESIAPTTPAPLAAAPAPGTPTTAAPTAGIQQIQTTIGLTGTYAELTLYLQKVQRQMRRAVLIESVALAESTESTEGGQPAATEVGASPPLKLTITGKVFVLDPKAVAVATGATTATAPSN